MDYARTVCYAVMPGFDTDCNGATAGSVLGLMLGRKRLPANWTDPIHDTLLTGVHGYHEVKLEKVAAEVQVPLEADGYSTVAGLLLTELGHVPRPGEKVEQQGLIFEVLEANQRTVLKVRVRRV
jgi:hypothetical protein